MKYLLFIIFCFPLLCRAQLNTPTKPAPKSANSPTQPVKHKASVTVTWKGDVTAILNIGGIENTFTPGASKKMSLPAEKTLILTVKLPDQIYKSKGFLFFESGDGILDVVLNDEIVVFKYTMIVTDIDGNVYNAVRIGDQIWMAENLKTRSYTDGVIIPAVMSDTAWSNLSDGAWCFYDNDPMNYRTYGLLYNWYAVNTGKLAPKGWHVPSDKEWETLKNFLGGVGKAGGNMKTTGSEWENPNQGATNSSSFSGLPGGWRHSLGTFIAKGTESKLWSSSESEYDAYFAWYFALNYFNSGLARDHLPKLFGMSVRCIKD